jgi:hypothetical protein
MSLGELILLFAIEHVRVEVSLVSGVLFGHCIKRLLNLLLLRKLLLYLLQLLFICVWVVGTKVGITPIGHHNSNLLSYQQQGLFVSNGH